ncbi:hypothetical protein HT118_08960 [Escherichia coli]|nr:hypothetical protein [Escherichia coli]
MIKIYRKETESSMEKKRNKTKFVIVEKKRQGKIKGWRDDVAMFTDCRMRRTVGQRRRVSVASDTLHRAQRKKKERPYGGSEGPIKGANHQNEAN